MLCYAAIMMLQTCEGNLLRIFQMNIQFKDFRQPDAMYIVYEKMFFKLPYNNILNDI